MTALQVRSTAARRTLPADLSPTGKLVYLYLSERGSATADELKATLGVPQIRLYPVLATLERRGLVRRAGEAFELPR